MISSDVPLSFQILVISILSVYFLSSLVRGLSILWIIPKNQLLISLIFSIGFLLSISFISILIFIILFLLLALNLVCSFFPIQKRPIFVLFHPRQVTPSLRALVPNL